ncbi:TPA: hypothetical protein N0F65_011431 [Lagenidium giganteum]|uniref:Serine/threonine-protein kinase ATR n=1 Tax=Lagenidium giganteum TaxID=4803 RepID=A0AAV2ZH09_9STRA|nr:TPA: hypothetical protein N0F65_011431 [Lagenidium giganteum]
MNDVKSLLQLVHTHRMQHEQGAYDAASSATIQRCKTMLVKLRKLLPKLMRPIATLPRDAATPMLRDLCQLMDALLQGSVCPHTMTLFLEDPVEDPAKLAGADYASCSYPTVATMIIYMVSFYSNPSLRDAHDNVLHVIVQLLLLVERTDVHGFRHFFHDTALLLQDCFLLEEHLKIHREIQESDLNVTISCFVDSAIHVYQGTDGPLGSKSKTRLCGCVPIEDHQQLTERRVQLQGMLPPIQVTSFHNLIMLRRSIVRMVDLLVQECGGVLRSSPAFVDLVRLLPLLLRSDRARLESVSSFSPVVPKDESLEVAKSSLKLFHTVLQTDLESEGALVDLIQAFLRSSMIKSSHDLIAEHAQVVDVLSSLFRLQPNTVMELIWPPMRQWLAEGSECILDVGAAHCAVFLSSVLRMLPLFLTNSDSVIIDPVIRFVTQLELAYVCDNVASDVVKLLLRILSFKSLSLKFFHVMAKILTTPAHYDEPEATSLKRKRDEGRNEQMLHAFVAEYNGQDDEHDALEDGSEGDHSKLSSVTEMLLNHIEFVLKEMILHQVQAENNENRIAEWEFLFRFLPENSTIRDVISHSPLRLLNHLAWELGGSRSSMAKKAFREVCQYLNQETTSRPGDLMHSDEFSMPRQHFLALLTDLGNKIGSKSSNTSINMKTQAIKSLHKLFALFKSSDPSKPSSHGVVDAFVPKVMAIVKIGLGEQELQDCAVVAWDSYVRMLSVKALESSLPSIVVSLLPCMGYDPMKLIIEGDNSGQGWLVDQLHFESVAETTQTQASDLCKTTAINLLKYLFRERGNELKHAFPRIPMLPAVSELDEVYVAIASEIGDPSTQQISKFLPGVVSYVNHWDSAVREVVLVQLLRCLVVRSSELHSMLQSDGNIYIDQAIVDLVLSILQLARTETQPTIKQLCARVLGALGAIDGARIPLSMFYMSNSSQGREKVDSRMEHSTKDLACVLIENWLVKELRAAPENTDAVAFAIQELLKFLTELTADSGQNGHPTSGAGSQMPEWMKKRFERKEKDVLQFVEPYWSTNYVISNPRHQRNHGSDSVDRALHPGVDDITFYEKYGATYEDWLLAWSKRLIHLSQAPERKIFLACRTALPSCPQMARFLLPYLIQNVLRSGNPEIYEEVKREVLAVLNDHERVIETEPRGTSSASTSSENNNERRLGEVLSRHHQCAQAIFSTFDELHEWIWISEKKRLALSASASRQSGSTRTIDVPSEMDDHEKENVEEFLKDIPSRSLSNAAFDIKAFARAIQYFEVYLRQQHVPPVDGKESANHSLACPVSLDIISKNATYLQLLYSNVEEPDYLTGLATLRRLFDAQRHHDGTQDRPMDDGLNLMDLMHQIVDHEQLAQWEDALACYEQAIQEIQSALSSRSFHPSRARHTRDSSLRYADGEIEADPETIKPELYTGVVRCLIQLGRLESALQHINGIVTQEPDYLATLYPFALECSWRLSRWDLLSDLLNSEQQNPLVLNSNSLGNMANVTRTRSGVDVSKLMLVRVVHSLHEGDIASFTKHLNAARLEIMGPLAAASAESYQRAYPLLHQLHFLHEAEQGFIAITKAKNQNIRDRKMLWKSQCAWEPRYEVLATALKFRDPILALRRVMLQELNLRQDVSFNWLRYAKLARKEGHLRTATSAVMHAEALDNQYASLQKAKLMVAQDRMYEALQILEPVDLDASKLVFDVDDPHFCAKNLLLATNWMQESGQRQGKKVIERYNAVIKFDPKWEKGYFYLAKYYEYLLSVTHPDARNEEALVVDSVFHTQLINLMKNYVLALKYGTKFLFQSMPRLLTLWFEYGEVFFSSTSRGSKTTKAMRHIELGMSQSSTEQQILTDINQVIEDALEQLPAYEWLVCFPQVISRICHPTPMVVEGVKKVMVKVLCAYPTQAMWPILGLSRSLNSQRRNRARDIISNAQRHFVSQGEQEVANSFSEGMRLVEELIALAGHDPGAQRRIHIRLSRIRTKILVPVQAALTTVLHSAGLAPSDSQHSAFADSGQVYIKSFSDKADVMMTKEKPKRVEVMGSDGNLYPFLCKREKTGDLRKDARMMEFNSMINKLLQKDPEGRRRKLRVRTYAVVCLNEESGMMEWVRNTKAMRQLIGQIHKTERGYIQPVRLTHEIKERFLGMQKKYADNIPTMALYYRRKILTLPAFTPRFHQWFYNNFADPTAWFESRLAFARSAAVWSMVGHIIGLGDRHGENILIDCTNGECVHVDFDCLFDKGLKLAKPEIVPFRLTPNMIDAFGITGYEGVFRRVCEVTMRLLRENKETLRSVLESFIHDPLVEWGRRGKTAQGSSGSGARGITDIAADRSKEETRIILKTIDDRLRGIYNLGDAVRPLLSSSHRSILPENDTLPLSVQGQVDKLIHEAVSHENLAQMYIGWMPFL